MGEDTEIIRKEEKVNRRIWAHGVGAAFIGGFSTAATTVFSALAFGSGFKQALEMAFVNCLMAGGVSVWAYLKQSPLPPLPKHLEVTTTTVTVTKESTEAPKSDSSPDHSQP